MEARSDAEKRLLAEQEKAEEAERRLQELEQSQAPGEALVDPAPFRQRIAAFADLPSEADRARRDRVGLRSCGSRASQGTPSGSIRLPERRTRSRAFLCPMARKSKSFAAALKP